MKPYTVFFVYLYQNDYAEITWTVPQKNSQQVLLMYTKYWNPLEFGNHYAFIDIIPTRLTYKPRLGELELNK